MSVGPRIHKASQKPLVALTGATGFIGRYLLQELPKRGYRLRVLLRRAETLPKGCAGAVIGDLARPYNMSEALAGVDAVIHTAGLAATMTGVPEDDYRLFNTEATVGFAKAAQRAKIKRFVFLSSIRAQSGPTAEGILTEEREPRSPYPLPLAGLKGEHSLLGLDNLVDAVDTVLAAEAPLRRPLIVADPKPLTIGAMIAAMRRGLGRRPALLYVPEPLMKGALHVSGRFASFEPLFGSLVADSSALAKLNWAPRVETIAGLTALLRDRNLS